MSPSFSSEPRATPQVVVRAALKSRTHSHENRRLARDLVWGWVGDKWPRLVPPRAQLESANVETILPGRWLTAATSEDGSAWTLEVSYKERDGACTWTTRAFVADGGDADIVALQTSCVQPPGPRRIAPPRVLSRWVDRLQLDDAGIPVRNAPHMVEGDDQLAALCDHLLEAERALPVILLGNKGTSRYYGVDPRGLAEAVCGLAHVACLTPDGIAGFTERFGRRLAPAPGAVRIYMPGFLPSAESRDHPLIRPARPAEGEVEVDAGAFRRFVCQRVCELSVVATRSTFGAA
jgi:hypothetical protein